MTKKLTKEEIVDRFCNIHGDRYDYSLIKYNGFLVRVDIICKIHGVFSTSPGNHVGGRGCPKCGTEQGASLIRYTGQKVIEDFRKVHGNYYDYSNMEYINNITKIVISCPRHGEFEVTPVNHKGGSGCPICGREKSDLAKRLTHEEIIQDFVEIHGDLYNYSKINYVNDGTKVIVICKKHGEFLIKPGNHKKGHGCIKCNSGNISDLEIKWLDSLNVPERYRQQKLIIKNKKIKVDAFDPISNTVYEFWGDYWHGNPNKYNSNDINQRNKKSFGELFEETQNKRQLLIDAGYKLIEIWELQYLQNENT